MQARVAGMLTAVVSGESQGRKARWSRLVVGTAEGGWRGGAARGVNGKWVWAARVQEGGHHATDLSADLAGVVARGWRRATEWLLLLLLLAQHQSVLGTCICVTYNLPYQIHLAFGQCRLAKGSPLQGGG